MAAGVQGIHHVGLSVPDLARARHFFVDLLGGTEVIGGFAWADNPFIDAIVGLHGSAAEMFMVRLGNAHVEVFEYRAPRSAPQDPDQGVNRFGYTHFALQVDDLAACAARLADAGCRLHTRPDTSGIVRHDDGRKTGYAAIYCRDWFGNVFELMEVHEDPMMPRV